MTAFARSGFRLHAIVITTVLCVSANSLHAGPANPKPFEAKQSDGTRIQLRVRGDEFFHWYEDSKGYTVVLNNGDYVYARLGDNGQLAPTDLFVGRSDPREHGISPKVLPSLKTRQAPRLTSMSRKPKPADTYVPVKAEGEVKNLVILCRFSDHHPQLHARDRADYDILLNAEGGHPQLAPTGSVRDVFLLNSYGKMKLTSFVQDWVVLPQTEAFYAGGADGIDHDGKVTRFPNSAQGMVKDALDLVSKRIKLADFDTNDDGYVDSITFIHSGYGAETGGGKGNWIWSHRWSLWQLPGGEWVSTQKNKKGIPVKVRDYHTEPALWGTEGQEITRIGVIAHETGHFFGLPDLYDTDGKSMGAGAWCIMSDSWGFDASQHHPPLFSAWCKTFLGWVKPTELAAPGVITIPQVIEKASIFKISKGYQAGEYLLVENRQVHANEPHIPQGGLAIWHIDERKQNNNEAGYPGQAGWPGNNRHYMVALLQADGKYHLETTDPNAQTWNGGDDGDLYHGGGKSALNATTTPNSNSYSNGHNDVTNVSISEISKCGPIMTFKLSFESGEVPSQGMDAIKSGSPWARLNGALALTSDPQHRAAATKAALGLLIDSDLFVRCAARDLLIQDKGFDVPTLIDALGHENLAMREEVSGVLGRMGKRASSAVPDLVKQLRSPSADVRSSVLMAIQAIGAYDDKTLLEGANLLADLDSRVAVKAAELLASAGLRAQAFMAFLEKQKNHQSALVRLAVAFAMASIESKNAEPAQEIRKALFQKQESELRVQAGEYLMQLSTETSTLRALLVDCIKSDDADLASKGAYIASTIPGVDITSAQVPKSFVWTNKVQVHELLTYRKDVQPQTLALLRKVANDPWAENSSVAAVALLRTNREDAQTRELLKAALPGEIQYLYEFNTYRPNSESTLRAKGVIEGLRYLAGDGVEAVPVLLRLVNAGSPELKELSLQALKEIQK
jgi:M6 family metalloprotease-like protein